MRKLASLLIGFILLGGVSSSSQPPGFWEEEKAYQAALQYIEQHRKSDVSIKVVDQAGAPVKNATVNYRQMTHDFAFGFIGNPGWATPSDKVPGWLFYEFTLGQNRVAQPGKAQLVSGENCRSGKSCLHIKVNRDQNLGINSNDVSVEPGVLYEITFWVRITQAPPSGTGPIFVVYWGKGTLGSPWTGQGVALTSITPTLTVGDYMPIAVKVTAHSAATRALVGVRVNMEGAHPGDVEFYLDDVTFIRDGTTQNLLRNPGFEEAEAAAWALWSELCQSMNAWIQLVWQVWPDIEPQPDVFQWEMADYWFQRILGRCPGAHFILLFSELSCGGCPRLGTYVPPWIPVEQLTDSAVFERFQQDLYDYVYRVAQRYADRVQWWSTMNELNWRVDELLGGDIQKAIEIDRVIIKAIRDAHPQAKVLLATSFFEPSRTFPTISPFEFAQRALKAGLQVDGITLQAWPYAQATPLFYQNYVRQLATLGKPVFIQETGYPSQPTQPAHIWQAWGGTFGEPTQAAWVKYITTIPYGTENVLGVLWVFAVDDNTIPNWPFTHMGLFTREGRTKQAYDVYRQHIRMFTTTGSGSTDESGKITFRGFAGKYTVTVTAPDGRKVTQTIHVHEKSENNFTVRLP